MVLVMEMEKNLVLFFLILIIMNDFGFCKGAEYKVGDSAGWTVIGNMDYNNWASSKTFQVGDTIVFEYDPLYHNVLEVSRSDYHTCNSTSPIARYASGNDSIVIRSPGHYYYICGFVGHCQAGQKVDIRVIKPTGPSAAPGPAQPLMEVDAPAASPYGPIGPSPSDSGGVSVLSSSGLFCGLLLFITIRLIF